MASRILLALFLTILLTGCHKSNCDRQLSHISEIVDNSPAEALRQLDCIDRSELNEADRHFFDFLRIKARNKIGLPNTSDSVVLDLVDWYESEPEFYAEALYYGGRVYSDLGEMPKALLYYRQALHQLSPDSGHSALRDSVIRATKILLNTFSIYGSVIPTEEAVLSIEAMPIIKKTVRIDKLLEDTVLNHLFDNLLSGYRALKDSNYNEASNYFRDSSKIKIGLNEETLLHTSKIQESETVIDSILSARKIPTSVSSLLKSNLISFAARLCQTSGLTTTETLHLLKAVDHNEDIDKNDGFRMLLSPELREVVSKDSLLAYVSGYNFFLLQKNRDSDNILNSAEEKTNSDYLYEKDRRKAESLNEKLISAGIAILFVAMILAILILWLKNRQKTTYLELLEVLNDIRQLKERINHTEGMDADTVSDNATKSVAMLQESTHPKYSATRLREELKNKLLSLYEMNPSSTLSPVIMSSSAYQLLQEKINDGKILKEDDQLWRDLEAAIEQVSPEFKTNLRLLTGGKLTSIDLHTALLVKCHVSPSQMASLLGRTKGAIVSRRENLCIRVFDKKMGTQIIDSIIRLL